MSLASQITLLVQRIGAEFKIRLRFDAAQVLTSAQQAQAQSNLGLTAAFDGYLASTVTPRELYAASGGAGAYPARPATARPIHFYGSNPPAANGSVLGGGGMVANLDQWFDWTAQ